MPGEALARWFIFGGQIRDLKKYKWRYTPKKTFQAFWRIFILVIGFSHKAYFENPSPEILTHAL